MKGFIFGGEAFSSFLPPAKVFMPRQQKRIGREEIFSRAAAGGGGKERRRRENQPALPSVLTAAGTDPPPPTLSAFGARFNDCLKSLICFSIFGLFFHCDLCRFLKGRYKLSITSPASPNLLMGQKSDENREKFQISPKKMEPRSQESIIVYLIAFFVTGKTYRIFVLGEFRKDPANRVKGVKWKGGGGETFLVLAARGDEGRGKGGEEGNYNKGGRESLRTGTKKCCKEEEEDGGSQQPDQGQILLQSK